MSSYITEGSIFNILWEIIMEKNMKKKHFIAEINKKL